MADRSLYQPSLLRKHVRALYLLKEWTGLPMTHHIRLAVEEYVERFCESNVVTPELSRGDRRGD